MRVTRGLAAIAVFASGCGVVGQVAAPGHDPARRVACTGGYGSIVQGMDGRVSGCLELGTMGAGPHTVSLDQPLAFSVVKPPLKISAHAPPQIRQLLYPPQPHVALSVSPQSGGPGTTVTITGRVLRPPPRTPLGRDHPTFCWDGCQFGLQYQGVPIRWTSARTFRAQLQVPGAPWIEGNPPRVVLPASRPYRIVLRCLVLGKLCAWERANGAVTFHLRAAADPSWCPDARSCAQLSASPAAALPGEMVSVNGFAPLVSITGENHPNAFQFAVLDGPPEGPEVTLSQFKDLPSALLGRAGLDVVAPPGFASLVDTSPLTELSAAASPISAQPAAPSTVAWCSGAGIDIWRREVTTHVRTRAAVSALLRMGLKPDPTPSCDAIALAGPRADPAAVIVAGFSATAVRYPAPPLYHVALVTGDGGRRWNPIPAPPGASRLTFGVFRYARSGVEAVFSAAIRNPVVSALPNLDPTKPLAEVSSGDGRSWRAAPLGCPPAGPCVTLGPAVQGSCAMGPAAQPLLRSTDGGIHWSQPRLPDQVQGCGEAELIATSSTDALLIDSMSQFPLQRTTDGGASWHVVGLPPAPGEQSYYLGAVQGVKSYVLGSGPGGITALPDGDLLLSGGQGYRGGWQLMRHGGAGWCAVRTPPQRIQSLPQRSSLTVLGGRVWWLTASGARTVELSQIAC